MFVILKQYVYVFKASNLYFLLQISYRFNMIIFFENYCKKVDMSKMPKLSIGNEYDFFYDP